MINVISPIEPDCGERGRYEFLERVGGARSDDEVVGLLVLKHAPHDLDVIGSPAPIATDREVAESKPLYDGMVKDMVKVVFDEVPRVPMFQPLMDVAMHPNISGYTYWFHLQPDYRQIVKK